MDEDYEKKLYAKVVEIDHLPQTPEKTRVSLHGIVTQVYSHVHTHCLSYLTVYVFLNRLSQYQLFTY